LNWPRAIAASTGTRSGVGWVGTGSDFEPVRPRGGRGHPIAIAKDKRAAKRGEPPDRSERT
jgi:hypothetical protein